MTSERERLMWVPPMAAFVCAMSQGLHSGAHRQPRSFGPLFRKIKTGRYPSTAVDLSEATSLLLRSLMVRVYKVGSLESLADITHEFELEANLQMLEILRLANLPSNFEVEIRCTLHSGFYKVTLAIIQKISVDDLPKHSLARTLYMHRYSTTLEIDDAGKWYARKTLAQRSIRMLHPAFKVSSIVV